MVAMDHHTDHADRIVRHAALLGRVLPSAPEVAALLRRDLDGPAAEHVERAARHLLAARDELIPVLQTIATAAGDGEVH